MAKRNSSSSSSTGKMSRSQAGRMGGKAPHVCRGRECSTANSNKSGSSAKGSSSKGKSTSSKSSQRSNYSWF